MGKRAYAGVSVPRLYDDIPDLNQQAVMSALITGSSISNALLLASMTGPASAINNMRRYGNGANYYYGSPQIDTSLDEDTEVDAWKTYLEGIWPTPIVILADDVQVSGLVGLQDYHGDYALAADPIVAPSTFSRFDYLPGGNIDIYAFDEFMVEYLHLTVVNPTLTNDEHYVRFESNNDGIERVDIYNEGDPPGPALPLTGAGTPPPPLVDEMYPLVPLRINGVDYDDGLAGSASIKEILKRISLDPADIVEGIKLNPDENLIDDVYLGAAISITATDDWAVAGLAELFQLFHERNPTSKTVWDTTGVGQNITFGVGTAGALDSVITYSYITSTTMTGTPGYTKSYASGTYTFTCPIADTGDYKEIVVVGLAGEHNIAVPGFGLKVVELPGDDENLVIPLMHTIVSRVPFTLKADLIFGSLRLYVYSYDIVKVKWYETGIFKVFLIVVTVVLAIYTGQFEVLAGAFQLGIQAGLVAIAKLLAIVAVVDYSVQWLVEELGVLGTILAVILSVYVAGRGGKINFASLTTTLNTGWYAIFTASTRVYGVYVTDQLNTLKDEQAEFTEEYEARLVELEAAQELLDFSEPLNLYDIVEYRSLPNTTINESPQAFYDRTSTIIDLPAISSSLVDDYYEAMALLPVVDSYLPTHQFEMGI